MDVVVKVIEVAEGAAESVEMEAKGVAHALDNMRQFLDEGHQDLAQFDGKSLGPIEDLFLRAATFIHNLGGTFAEHHVSEDGVQVAVEAHTAENGATGERKTVYQVALSHAETPAQEASPEPQTEPKSETPPEAQ